MANFVLERSKAPATRIGRDDEVKGDEQEGREPAAPTADVEDEMAAETLRSMLGSVGLGHFATKAVELGVRDVEELPALDMVDLTEAGLSDAEIAA